MEARITGGAAMQPITPEQQMAEQAAWDFYIARRKAMADEPPQPELIRTLLDDLRTFKRQWVRHVKKEFES
jgi:hypothetical protein